MSTELADETTAIDNITMPSVYVHTKFEFYRKNTKIEKFYDILLIVGFRLFCQITGRLDRLVAVAVYEVSANNLNNKYAPIKRQKARYTHK